MINLMSEIPTLSNSDVLTTLAKYMDEGTHDNEELLRFVSDLTGVSEDAIMQAIKENQLLSPFTEQKTRKTLSREKILGILQSYVSNDAEAAELDYVQEALEQAGCGQEEAEQLGLAWVWPE